MKTLLTFVFCLTIGAHLIAQTVALPYMVVVKPTFIQNGAAGNISVQTNYAASFALFQDATQRVYAQAGIRIVWEAASVFTDSSFYIMDGSSTQLSNLAFASGNGKSVNPTTLNVWFTGSNGGLLGVSGQSDGVVRNGDTRIFQNRATVAESVFVPGSNYSLTTLPHELGHVLGLDHNVINVGGSPTTPTYTATLLTTENLMSQGLGATTFNSITSNGTTGFGILTAGQIDMLKLSPFVQTNSVGGDSYTYSAIPEPADFALAAGAMSVLFAIGRRRKSRSVCSTDK